MPIILQGQWAKNKMRAFWTPNVIIISDPFYHRGTGLRKGGLMLEWQSGRAGRPSTGKTHQNRGLSRHLLEVSVHSALQTKEIYMCVLWWPQGTKIHYCFIHNSIKRSNNLTIVIMVITPYRFDNLYTQSITKYDWNKKELHRKKF